jgi:hypothetical protein
MNVAVITPPLVLRFTGLPTLLPSMANCTVPVGVPPGLAVRTAAVNTTFWPNTDGLEEALTSVVVAGLLLTT